MTLVAIRVLIILAGLAWKAYHLARRPHDWPLRAVVACFAFFALSTPMEMWPANRPFLGLRPTVLSAVEYSLIMCASLCIMLFFAGRRQQANPRRLLATHTPMLLIGVIVVVALGSQAPATVPMRSYTDPWAAGMYLASEIYIGLVLLVATRYAIAVARSPEAGRTQARGIGIAGLGLALLAVATLLLAAVQITTLSTGTYVRVLGATGGYGLLIGGPLFIIGICFPGVVMRARAIWLWNQRRREYRRLEPLASLLAATFPHQSLRRGGSTKLATLPRLVDRAHHRRRVEARDGLVRLSPHVPGDAIPDISDVGVRGLPAVLAPLAQWMAEHCGAGDDNLADQGRAKRILVPADGTPETDMLLLIALSDALATTQRPARSRRWAHFLSRPKEVTEPQ